MKKRNLILALLAFVLISGSLFLYFSNFLVNPPGSETSQEETGHQGGTSPTSRPPSHPTPTFPALTAPLNPQHGIHAPVGGEWPDIQRNIFSSFRNSAGEKAAPGLVVALSVELKSSNNQEKVTMEEDLFRYRQLGTQVYIRMYPQRFPGAFTEKLDPRDGRNTISGSPQDAVQDIILFLQGQERRTGHHFTKIIPGNEPNLEWPDRLYFQNVLTWQSGDDPQKYERINSYFVELFQAWQDRLNDPGLALFRDVELFFPALAQDGHPGNFGGAFFYENDLPVENKYDRLRPAIKLFGRFSWHNYFRPGKAWEDRVATNFPRWLKQELSIGMPRVISEAGWTPDALYIPYSLDSEAATTFIWKKLNWSKKLALNSHPRWHTQDEILEGKTFEDEIRYFITVCAGDLGDSFPALKPGVAVWLAGSEGNFYEALGVEPGSPGAVRRWFENYASWHW